MSSWVPDPSPSCESYIHTNPWLCWENVLPISSQRTLIISGFLVDHFSSRETSRNFASNARNHVFVSKCWWRCSRRPLRCRSTCCWFPEGWRCRSRAPSTCPGPGGALDIFVRLSSLLFVLKKCIFSEHRVYPQLKKPSLVGGVATPPKTWVRLDHHPNSWGNNGKFLKAMF